jgi:probable F420-dependent oxidoreductase
VKVGFGLPVSGAWATPENIASFARRAEAAGYASLWTFQRLLVPDGSAMEPVYHSVLDPMAALAFAAAVTNRIRLGVAVVNLPFVSPGYLAKQAASLDVLSGGRHDLGLGVGWMPEEFTLAGAPMQRRGARAAEYVRVLRTLWADGQAEFSGEFYTVPRGTSAPAPVQPGGPPILLGGLARRALERAGQVADGWVTSSRTDLSAIAGLIAVVRDAAAAAGRDPAAVRIVCRGVVRAGQPALSDSGERLLLSGSADQIRQDAQWLAGQGVTEVFYDLNWDPLVGAPHADYRAATDRAASLLEALAPGEPDEAPVPG